MEWLYLSLFSPQEVCTGCSDFSHFLYFQDLIGEKFIVLDFFPVWKDTSTYYLRFHLFFGSDEIKVYVR